MHPPCTVHAGWGYHACVSACRRPEMSELSCLELYSALTCAINKEDTSPGTDLLVGGSWIT